MLWYTQQKTQHRQEIKIIWEKRTYSNDKTNRNICRKRICSTELFLFTGLEVDVVMTWICSWADYMFLVRRSPPEEPLLYSNVLAFCDWSTTVENTCVGPIGKIKVKLKKKKKIFFLKCNTATQYTSLLRHLNDAIIIFYLILLHCQMFRDRWF
jgi:hypothetical protein